MRTSPVHYIAPSSISVIANANSLPDDVAVTVAKGAKIKVYALKSGIDYENGSFQEWTFSGRNRRLAESNKPYTIYARLPKQDKTKGYLVFAPKNGDAQAGWTDKYAYVTTDGLSGTPSAANDTYWFIRIGDVSLPENGQRTITFDTGILGTDEFNTRWTEDADELPLRVEIGCTIDDEDAGPTPYVYWFKQLVLTAVLKEGWSNTDVERFDHWTIERNTGDAQADAAWPTAERAAAFAQSGRIVLSHARGVTDDFNSAVSTVFTVTAWGRPEAQAPAAEEESSEEPAVQSEEPASNEEPAQEEASEGEAYVQLAQATINISAEVVEKYELVLSSDVVNYNPKTDSYTPASGVTVNVRAIDQRNISTLVTNEKLINSNLDVECAPVNSETWVPLTFSGASGAVAEATISTEAFSGQYSLNVRLVRKITTTTEGENGEEVTVTVGKQELARKTIAFVRDGEDTRNREWIFLRSTTAITFSDDPTAEHPLPSLISGGQVNPTGAATGSDTNKNQDGWVPQGWWDEEQGVDSTNCYEYSAYRDYVYDSGTSSDSSESSENSENPESSESSENTENTENSEESDSPSVVTGPHWGDFSVPKIWSHFGKDGSSITKISETYRYATNNTGIRPAADSSEWSTVKPVLQKGFWLFTETTILWSDGSTTVLYTDERNPNDGVTGDRIASCARILCAKVEWIDANGNVLEQTQENLPSVVKFRCYFRSHEDGKAVVNKFVANDQAFCWDNNVYSGSVSQHSYWRLVTATHNAIGSEEFHYIDLSATDCEDGSDVPKVHDEIYQLGNRTITNRQGAIIENVTGTNGPSYRIYQGINNFSLTDKDYVSMGYSPETYRAFMNVYGDAFIGARDNSTFLKYDAGQKKLTIKAQIDVQSTVGDSNTTLNDYIARFASGVNVFSRAMGNLDSNGYPAPPYSVGDLWVDAYYPKTDITVEGQTIKAGSVFNHEIAVCVTANNTPHKRTVADPETGEETEETYYDPFNISDWEHADSYQHNFDFLSAALSAMQGSTQISGGLILSSLIALRDTAATPNIWSGISGIFDSSKKGYGIAAWYGGDMIDREAVQEAHTGDDPAWIEPQWGAGYRYAKSLNRFDGSGYVASGNLSWDSGGNLTIKQVRWGDDDLKNFFNSFSVGLVNNQLKITPRGDFTLLKLEHASGYTITNTDVLNYGEMKGLFVTKTFFNRLFKAYNGNTAINVNDEQSVIDNLEILVGAWTKKFLSALGKSANGGGPTLAEPLASINTSGLAAPADAQDGMTIVWNKATQKWKYGTAGGGSGTLSSIALQMPTGFQVQGTPITGTGGTFTVSFAGSISPHRVLASPSTDNGAPSWRQLSSDDISDLSSNYLSLTGGTMANENLVTKLNAELLNGMRAVVPGTDQQTGVYGGRIPFIGTDYVMEVGRYLDFHAADGLGDFSTRLYLHQADGAVDANGNNVMLPSGSGVLALTSDNVASATKLQTARKIWGQNFDGTADIGSANAYAAMSFVNSIDDLLYFYNNNVGIGVSSPAYKLHVNGYAFATRLYLADGVFLEYNSQKKGVKLTGAGFYTDSYVSALGYSAGSGGGGGGGGVTALAELSDVVLSSPASGMALVYNASAQKWANTTMFTSMSYSNNVLSVTIGGVTRTVTIEGGGGGGGGVSISEPLESINALGTNPSTSGQGLVWNGSSWGYGAVSGSSDIVILDAAGVDALLAGIY